MAEALVGGALLSSFLNVLFERLATKEIVDLFRSKKVILKLLDELKIRLWSANSLLNDAEEKQFRDQNVKSWLEKLKEVLYKADHVMDKINTEALRRKVEEGESGSKAKKLFNFAPKIHKAFDHTVKSELQEILNMLKLLLDQNNLLGLKEGVHWKPLQITSHAPLVEESGVFGRDTEKESLIECLLSDDVSARKISVIPIMGLGGIGKTTLAQLVYYDSKVQEHFELKAWVTVAEEFDVLKITKVILKTITSTEYDIEDLHQLQNGLKNALLGKKFLIVLDDVWNEYFNLWDLLKSPFEFGANGSKIIVTTRNGTVALKMGTCKPYDLQTISNDDSWNLFAKHLVFDNLDSGVHSDFRNIGFEIVKKCKGLPLAVKSIVGILRSVSDIEEWRRVLQSDVWELQFEENQKHGIPPALWLSYRFLPQQMKRCFAYCSVFPKDYEFRADDQERLIWLWMAEGLLQPKTGKTMEDVGEEYLKALVSRSFFQQATGYGESTLMMHDLVHDLAIRVSGEFYFIQDGSNYLHDCKSNIYHLSYLKRHDNMKLESLPQASFLHTCLRLPLSIPNYAPAIMTKNILQELLLSGGGCLRALSLSQSSITMLPDSIGNLKHLRYLDLSGTKLKELPSPVCTLYNLQTLLLLGCRQLKLLPTNLCRLISLRHLVIRDTALKEMPPQMCKLTNLQTLSNFVLGEKSGSRIKELGALQNLRGNLCISGIENVVDIGDVLEADLKKKERLTELILIWKLGETDETSKATDVLDALVHRNLKILEIRGHHGNRKRSLIGGRPYSFIFMGNFALEKWPTGANQEGWLFPCLKHLDLSDCKKLNMGLPAGFLPSLESIEIRYCKEMVSVFPASQEIDIAYPSLESIVIDGCDKLNVGLPAGCLPSLERIEIQYCKEIVSVFPASQEIDIAYPSLESINIFGCDKLNVGLPSGCLPSLENIDIRSCNEMVSVFPASQEIDIAYPSLESIQISECENVESFSKMDLPSNLKELKIWDCKKLIANRRKWNLQRLSNLQRFVLDRCEDLVENSFPEEGMLPSSLTSLSILRLTNLKSLNGKGFQHLTSLQHFRIACCEKVEWLPEEGLPLSLSTLWIYRCPLLRERCKRETGEDWPKIQHIPAIEIDWKQI